MRTLLRLLIIAGLVSFFRGPFKTEHPEAYQQSVTAIQTIPHLIGQMLTNDLALLPKQSPSPSIKGATPKEDHTPTEAQPLSILSDLIKIVEGASSGKFGASSQLNAGSGLSQGVIGIPTNAGILNHLQVTGLSHQEVGQLIGHMRTLDLIQVVPKLEALSAQIQQMAHPTSGSAPLSTEEQKKWVNVYQETAHVLKINPSFSIEQGKSQQDTPISFSKLLNQANLKKDKVTVQIDDQSHHELARFTVSFSKATPSTPVLSQKTESHPF